MIFDEYHFGAWRDNAKKLFEMDNEDEDYDFDMEKYKKDEAAGDGTDVTEKPGSTTGGGTSQGTGGTDENTGNTGEDSGNGDNVSL